MGFWKWCQTSVILGINAILIFTLSEVLAMVLWTIAWKLPDGNPLTLHDYIYEQYFSSWINPINASLLFAIAFVLLM
jgi:predicted acyltransferase